MTGNGCAFSDPDFKAGAIVIILLSGIALLVIVGGLAGGLAWVVLQLIDAPNNREE